MSEHIDEIILHRLRKLRTTENSPGSASGASSSSSSLPPGNKRSATEQVEDLLKQLSEESKLDKNLQEEVGDIDALITARLEKLKAHDGLDLAKLKSREASTKTKPAPRLLLTAAEHDDLSAGTEFGGEIAEEEHYSSEEEDSDHEDDTCALCDGKPTIICIDCFKDSYCSKCFAEYHAEGENHKTIPYRKKK